MTDARQNWIGARWCGAASGDGFDLAHPSDRSRTLGRWPRSGREDARAALAAATMAAPIWNGMPRAERVRFLSEAARALDMTPDPDGLIAACLSLDAGELTPNVADSSHTLELAIRQAPHAGTTPAPCVALHVPHWSELVREPARRLFTALAAGRTVVLLSDRRLPMAAGAIVTALAHAGLPPGVLSLLHDDGATCLRELLAQEGVGEFCAAGPRADLRRFARQSVESASRARLLDLVALCNRSHVVGLETDPDVAAAHVIDAAFGRARSLSGQAPGQLGRVLCHERVFSRFSAALLSGLERSADIQRPIPLIDAGARDYAFRTRSLGLDEGATLIHPRSLETAGARDDDPPAAPSAVVFTNVEPFLRLAGLSRPSPCLCLMRVVSEPAGAALALSFDQAAVREDLSASLGEAATGVDALESDT